MPFYETPPYDKLRHQLRSALISVEKAPNELFEWSKFQVRNPWLIEKDLLREAGIQVYHYHEGECLNREHDEKVQKSRIDKLSPGKLAQIK